MNVRPFVRPLLSLLCTAVLATACAPESLLGDDELAEEGDDALRHGQIADGEHPEVGILTTPTGGYCTGTLIGPRTVLTAAHCFDFASAIAADSAPPIGYFIIAKKGGGSMKVGYHRHRADAYVWEVAFDIGIAQLDQPIPFEAAEPAVLADAWPEDGETLTVYGYGRSGKKCAETDSGALHKRKDEVEIPDGFWERVTCPGDSGGPYFDTGTNEIVAVVKGDGLGVEWVGDAIRHRDWILEQLDASERGELGIDD